MFRELALTAEKAALQKPTALVRANGSNMLHARAAVVACSMSNGAVRKNNP
jgi:hypothetical protein